MESGAHLFEALLAPQFKTYFLSLLKEDDSPEEIYQKVIDYLRAEALKPTGHEMPHPPSYKHGIEPESLLPELAASIQRAVGRLKRSQHQDGGWGSQVEQSDAWQTAYALLCLGKLLDFHELVGEIEITPMLERGYSYIELHPEIWAADAIEPEGFLSVYNLSQVTRCFFECGREFVRREVAVRIYRSIDHLHHAQNEDGGWDASLWGYAVMTPTRIFSEVGATSYAMQAMAAVCDERFIPAIQRAARWLSNTQNLDGSWNNGSIQPDLPALALSGQGRVNKTCDALMGFFTLKEFDLSLQPYRWVMDRAVDWLHRQAQPVLEKESLSSSWGQAFSAADYENTCLTLETLLKAPEASLPFLAQNAAWLVQSQRKQADDVEDGSWVLGHTARNTCALMDFYRRLRGVQAQYPQWMP